MVRIALALEGGSPNWALLAFVIQLAKVTWLSTLAASEAYPDMVPGPRCMLQLLGVILPLAEAIQQRNSAASARWQAEGSGRRLWR